MLRAESISKSYGSVTVNADISLQFESGSVTAIVGDNGAGKSTLLKILAGLLKPDSGHVSLSGTALTKCTPHFYRSAGIEMVYQNLALARNHDVVTNLFAGRVVLFVSHRLNDVLEISDRIVVLKKGCVHSDEPAGKLTITEVVERIVG